MENEIKAPTVGMILVSTWGYDQTNVDFYQVVKVMGKMVQIQRIGSKMVSQHETSNGVIADPTVTIGAPLRRAFRNGGCKVNSYKSAWVWDGSPERETALGYGH